MWTEQDHASRAPLPVTQDRAQELDRAKAEALPHVVGEPVKPFEALNFQPVIGPGIYEAEFVVKGKDIIFHFWPYGYKAAIESGKARPSFRMTFSQVMRKTMADVFTEKDVETDFDRDLGSWFVRAKGWGEKQFARELSIKVCETIFNAFAEG